MCRNTLGAAVAASVIAWSFTAGAQNTTVVQTPQAAPAPAQPVAAQPVVAQPVAAQPVAAPVVAAPASSESKKEVVGPNMTLITTGLLTFGVPYVTSVIVAAGSDHAGDGHLYVPIAGPWMDLGDRGGCGGTTGRSCDAETTYKVLLVGDGILQAAGAVQILAGFVFPETREVTTVPATAFTPKMTIAPTQFGRGSMGVGASARF